MTFKVFNRSKDEKKIEIELIKVGNSPFEPKEGYEDCPNPFFLILSDRVFTLPGNGEKEIEMYIAFPREGKYRAKKYMFVVHMTVVDQPDIEAYSRVYVSLK